MNNQTKNKWDSHYHSCSDEYPEAADVLFQNQHLLPERGTALDLACGRGANAICLAKNNLTVSAWDISTSALEHLSHQASEKNLSINIEARDVSEYPVEKDSFDVIVISHFLDRKLMSHIKNAIKQDGLVFYQTFIKDKASKTGTTNPDYLLNNNELLYFFNDWNIIVYREEGTIGKTGKGFRNQAMLIAQKL